MKSATVTRRGLNCAVHCFAASSANMGIAAAGTPQSDTFIDGAGNQTYGVANAAGAAPDGITFAAGHGHDIIYGADTSGVAIDLHGFAGLASYADVFNNETVGSDSYGAYTQIATPDGGSIRLEGVGALQSGWFSFT